ncbi:MAG TPA: FixH family protein [Anaerolineales bacterium]
MKQPKSRSKPVRVAMGILNSPIVFAALYFVAMNRLTAKTNSEVPADLDYSTTRLSDKSLFSVSYTASTGMVPVNQMHQWTLHVQTAEGHPVENATIAVDGDMPQHGHGLPTQPRVTKYLGNGDYLVDGMKFQMGGWWLMDFTITANGQTDVVHFNMMLH